MEIKDYTVELKEIHLYAHHGVMEQERTVGAWFTIDLTLTVGNHTPLLSDCIEDAINYADVYECVCKEMYTPSQLLENVCHRISAALYDNFPAIENICITLKKDTPPMGGDRLSAAVTVRSER